MSLIYFVDTLLAYTDRDSKFKIQARKRPEFEPDAVDAEAVQLE